MESLSRYVYEKGPIEMANQLCELKIETFNQILINRGELARIMDKEAREEGKSYPPISKSIRLTYQEADRLCRNVVAVIGKMLPGIDGKSKEEEWKTEEKAPRKEIPGFRRMDKTSAQEAADVRICSIDKVVTETMEKMTKEVCQNASAGMANRLYRIKLQTFNEILNKRVEGTKAIDKALREGRSIDDAIISYSNESMILLHKFLDACYKMLEESEEKKEEMVPIRARTQYASIRALLSVETAFHGELDQPFYLSKEMNKNQWHIYKDDIRIQVGKYEMMILVENVKTWKQVEKLLKDDPKANVEPILFEYQQFLFGMVEKAKKEGLDWKKKFDDAAVKKVPEIKETVTVEKENEPEKEKNILEKKEEVPSKNELKVEKEKVSTNQIAELKSMMNVMKEEMLQEFNKKFESAQEDHKKDIEEVQKGYCRLENELKEVKEEHKKEIEEIRNEIQTSSKDDRIKELEMKLAERDGQLTKFQEMIERYKKESAVWKVKEQELYRRLRENQIDWIDMSEKTEKIKQMAMEHDEKMRMELTKKVLEAEDSHEKLADSEEEVKRLNEIVEALNKKLEEICESSEKMTLEMAKKQRETENELEEVKKELKETKEELERIQEEDSEEDSSFDQLDDE